MQDQPRRPVRTPLEALNDVLPAYDTSLNKFVPANELARIMVQMNSELKSLHDDPWYKPQWLKRSWWEFAVLFVTAWTSLAAFYYAVTSLSRVTFDGSAQDSLEGIWSIIEAIASGLYNYPCYYVPTMFYFDGLIQKYFHVLRDPIKREVLSAVDVTEALVVDVVALSAGILSGASLLSSAIDVSIFKTPVLREIALYTWFYAATATSQAIGFQKVGYHFLENGFSLRDESIKNKYRTALVTALLDSLSMPQTEEASHFSVMLWNKIRKFLIVSVAMGLGTYLFYASNAGSLKAIVFDPTLWPVIRAASLIGYLGFGVYSIVKSSQLIAPAVENIKALLSKRRNRWLLGAGFVGSLATTEPAWKILMIMLSTKVPEGMEPVPHQNNYEGFNLLWNEIATRAGSVYINLFWVVLFLHPILERRAFTQSCEDRGTEYSELSNKFALELFAGHVRSYPVLQQFLLMKELAERLMQGDVSAEASEVDPRIAQHIRRRLALALSSSRFVQRDVAIETQAVLTELEKIANGSRELATPKNYWITGRGRELLDVFAAALATTSPLVAFFKATASLNSGWYIFPLSVVGSLALHKGFLRLCSPARSAESRYLLTPARDAVAAARGGDEEEKAAAPVAVEPAVEPLARPGWQDLLWAAGLPLVASFVTQAIAQHFFHYITETPDDQANNYVEQVTGLVGSAAAGAVTYGMSARFRP